MKQNRIYVLSIVCVLLLFLLSSLSPGVLGVIQTPHQDSSIKDTVKVRCVVGGRPIQKQLSIDSCRRLQQLFSTVIEANAVDPCGQGTRTLKVQFIELLADLGLLAHTCSVEEICSLIEPPWLKSGVSSRWSHLIHPGSSDADNVTLMFCSMAGAGWGFVIPPFMLPRPRLLMQWRGFYPDSSAVSVAEMATGRGVIARGTQVGTAFGFIGVGFAFAFPGSPAQFGFLGYSLMTTLQATDMTWYYANFPPLVMQISPEDGAVDVPVSLSELRFTLKDYDFDKMTYSVTTTPDIGSGSDANVGNGEYSIPVSGLESGTTYTWTVAVSDGTDTVENTFSFTTEAVAPIISNPIPANAEKYVPIDITQLQFTLKDPQGDMMEYTVETSPDIGSQHQTGVYDGTFMLPVSGLTYGVTYHWFVNATDGENSISEEFWFRTNPIMVFDPFAEGWEYRKMITVDHTLVAGNLQHFPVVLTVTDSDLRDKAQNDGDDILFMDGVGVATRLYHENEEFDGSTGHLVAWVNVSSLDPNNDTIFYMYYGNIASSDQQCPEKVWDSDFVLVQHFNEKSGILFDSTTYSNDGIAYGGVNQNVVGKIGNANGFDGSDDYVESANSQSLNPSNYISLEAWYKPISFRGSGSDPIIDKGYYSDQSPYYQYHLAVVGDTYPTQQARFEFYIANSAFQDVRTGNNFWIPNVWYHLVGTYDGSTMRLYINGELIDTRTVVSTMTDFGKDVRIARFTNRYNCLPGTIDEVRISSFSRSADWILTEYHNQNNPSSFLDFGPEESPP